MRPNITPRPSASPSLELHRDAKTLPSIARALPHTVQRRDERRYGGDKRCCGTSSGSLEKLQARTIELQFNKGHLAFCRAKFRIFLFGHHIYTAKTLGQK